jgi:hypothetical protein
VVGCDSCICFTVAALVHLEAGNDDSGADSGLLRRGGQCSSAAGARARRPSMCRRPCPPAPPSPPPRRPWPLRAEPSSLRGHAWRRAPQPGAPGTVAGAGVQLPATGAG